MAGQAYISVYPGISTAIIEATTKLEKAFSDQEIYIEKERMHLDKQWIKNLLQCKPGIRYIRVVKSKPEGGIFVKRRYYFDAFLVKRTMPGTLMKYWMLYLVILSR